MEPRTANIARGWVLLIGEAVSRHEDWGASLVHVADALGIDGSEIWFRSRPECTLLFLGSYARDPNEAIARVYDPVQYQRALSRGDLEGEENFAGPDSPQTPARRSHQEKTMKAPNPNEDKPQPLNEFVVLADLIWKGKVRHPGERIVFARQGLQVNRDRWLKAGRIRPVADEERTGSEPVLPRGKVGQAANAVTQVQLVALDKIRPDPTQPRKEFGAEAMAELVQSIREHGVEQAILVRPRPEGSAAKVAVEWYEIVYGERRWRAAKAAGLSAIPAKVRDLTDIEAAEKQGIENLERDDLKPLEVAAQYRKLLDLPGYGMDRLMQATGHAKNTIYGKLKLLELPDEAREAVQRGDLPEVTAERLGRLKGEVQQLAVKAILHAHPGERDGGKLPSDRTAQHIIEQVKREAEAKAKAEAIKADAIRRGLIWLEGKERERIFEHSYYPRTESGLIALDQPAEGHADYCSYKQLLGKKPGRRAAAKIAPTKATMQHGNLLELYDVIVVRAALVEAGVTFSNRKHAADPQAAAQRNKDKLMRAVLDKAALQIHGRARLLVPIIAQGPTTDAMWRALAHATVRHVKNDDLRAFAKRHALTPLTRDWGMGGKPVPMYAETVEQWLDDPKRGLSEIVGAMAELLLTAGAWWSGNKDFIEGFRNGAEGWGIDLAALKEAQGGGDAPAISTDWDGEGAEEDHVAGARTPEQESAAA